MHYRVWKHFIGCKELKIVICWICSSRRSYLLKSKGPLLWYHLYNSCIHWTLNIELWVFRKFLHSSVNKTVWKLFFMYVWAHCNRFCLWALVRGGRIVGLCTTASLWRILHLEVCGTPGAPAASNTCLLLCNGILAAALLIRWICLAETFLILPSSLQTCLSSEWAPNLSTVQWSGLSFREISNVILPCPRHCTIWCFSAAERSVFFPILLEICGLLNNVERPS